MNPRLICAVCHGEGVVTIGGQSVNPFSGVLVNDPQQARDGVCSECRGSGWASEDDKLELLSAHYEAKYPQPEER